jgi:Leu/Phe-tRNA-protein transferase
MRAPYPLRYTQGGYVFIGPEDDPEGVVDGLLATDYREEFCVAADFDPVFAAGLMAAGFLVMSAGFPAGPEDGDGGAEEPGDAGGPEGPPGRVFVLLPKLHLERSVLFFPELHVKKSILPFLSRYELGVDRDFDRILRRCVEVHGDGWLTAPLRGILRKIRRLPEPPARPVSFGVYREGKLRAGEIGVFHGRVYTSYSGYYDEDNAGTVQMILMCRWLEGAGYAFLDLGMPLDYKDRLGARNLGPARFVELFRGAGL